MTHFVIRSSQRRIADDPSSRTHHQPLGADGFEFVRYTAPDAKGIDAPQALFVSWVLPESGQGTSASSAEKNYRRGTSFVVNAEPHSQAEVRPCPWAERLWHGVSGGGRGPGQRYAIAQGAKPFVGKIGPMGLNIPAIYGIGESTLSFCRPLWRAGLHL